MPTDVLKDIREQMWKEQSGLCAYCMKRIKEPGVVRIEHCRPRHPQDEKEHDRKATLSVTESINFFLASMANFFIAFLFMYCFLPLE